MDYTLNKYEELVECLASSGRNYSIIDYIHAQDNGYLPEQYYILRHDADDFMDNALKMAEIDARYGLSTTFYIRMKPRLFQSDIIKKISALGHEIGYHYEVLSDTKGDSGKAKFLFEENLCKLRKIVPVKTVCMHGRSFSKYNNLDFFKEFTLEEFGLVAEPYLSIDYTDTYYFTDTGLCWDNKKFNMRDHVRAIEQKDIKCTNDLISFIKNPVSKKIAVLTHTNNWFDSKMLWSINKSVFSAINFIKYIRKCYNKNIS